MTAMTMSSQLRFFSAAATNASPRLLREVNLGALTVSIWYTDCLVKNPPPSSLPCLIVPSNPSLTGASRFPYFPRGGPVPTDYHGKGREWQPLGYVTSWGGMDVGTGMVYGGRTVDGVVHREAGKGLQDEIAGLRGLGGTWAKVKSLFSNSDDVDPPILVETGEAIVTSPHNLSGNFGALIHTPPPFRDDVDSRELLGRCYGSALARARGETTVSPLLGCGCRGFENEEAAAIFWRAMTAIGEKQGIPKHVLLCVNDAKVGEAVVEAAQM